jgi:hypothetical protein
MLLSTCSPAADNPADASVALPSAARSSCGEAIAASRPLDPSCGVARPLDTLHWIGFGPFAASPIALSSCDTQGIDSLLYGEIEVDADGAVSGTQLVFERRGDSLRGAQIEPEGGRDRPIAFQELTRTDGDSLIFWTSAGGVAKYEHRVALTCDRLTGSYRTLTLSFGAESGSTSAYDTFSVTRVSN